MKPKDDRKIAGAPSDKKRNGTTAPPPSDPETLTKDGMSGDDKGIPDMPIPGRLS